MTRQEALKILSAEGVSWISRNADGSPEVCKHSTHDGESSVALDGNFTLTHLKALIVVIESEHGTV